MAQTPRQLEREVLSRILAVARHLSATADLRDILQVVIDAMRDTLNADRATVFEYDANTNELLTTVAHGVTEDQDPQSATVQNSNRRARMNLNLSRLNPAQELLREIRIPATTGLAGECAQSRRIINVPDAYADRRFNQDIDRQTGYRTTSILTVPLLGHDQELVGVAQVLNKRGGIFTSDDEELAQALAAQAAVAIKRGRLLQDRIVREKLERDLEVAHSIQQCSFPDRLPTMTQFDIAAWSQPADSTGGDVYDVMERHLATEHPAEKKIEGDQGPVATSAVAQRVVLLLADATGHGVGPALSITQLRSMLRIAVRLGADLRQIAQHANRQLREDLPGGRFITAFFGELDDHHSTLSMLSAGQAPLLHLHGATSRVDVLDACTVPLGIVDDLETVASTSITLHAGDVFAVCSDGFFEARNEQGEQFGVDRVTNCIRHHIHDNATMIMAGLCEALERFTGGQAADDDRTAIIIKQIARH